jgi:drug/metabolite transporter (DMT)-like permease
VKSKHADLLLILITAIWGLSFPIMRNSLAFISEITYLLYRFTLASLVLLVIFRRKYKKINRTVLFRGVLLGISLSGALGFTVVALQFTTASNVAFITGLNIVVVPFASNIISRKKIDLIKRISIILALFGLFFISGGVELRFNRGDFFALLCALCISAQIILTDIFARDEDPITLGCLQVNIAAIIYFIMCFIGGGDFSFKINAIVVITILITGIAGTALAFVGQTYIQKYTTPSHVAIIFILEPVFGAVFALLIPKLDGTIEMISSMKAIGCILLIASMLLTEFFSRRNTAT